MAPSGSKRARKKAPLTSGQLEWNVLTPESKTFHPDTDTVLPTPPEVSSQDTSLGAGQRQLQVLKTKGSDQTSPAAAQRVLGIMSGLLPRHCPPASHAISSHPTRSENTLSVQTSVCAPQGRHLASSGRHVPRLPAAQDLEKPESRVSRVRHLPRVSATFRSPTDMQRNVWGTQISGYEYFPAAELAQTYLAPATCMHSHQANVQRTVNPVLRQPAAPHYLSSQPHEPPKLTAARPLMTLNDRFSAPMMTTTSPPHTGVARPASAPNFNSLNHPEFEWPVLNSRDWLSMYAGSHLQASQPTRMSSASHLPGIPVSQMREHWQQRVGPLSRHGTRNTVYNDGPVSVSSCLCFSPPANLNVVCDRPRYSRPTCSALSRVQMGSELKSGFAPPELRPYIEGIHSAIGAGHDPAYVGEPEFLGPSLTTSSVATSSIDYVPQFDVAGSDVVVSCANCASLSTHALPSSRGTPHYVHSGSASVSALPGVGADGSRCYNKRSRAEEDVLETSYKPAKRLRTGAGGATSSYTEPEGLGDIYPVHGDQGDQWAISTSGRAPNVINDRESRDLLTSGDASYTTPRDFNLLSIESSDLALSLAGSALDDTPDFLTMFSAETGMFTGNS